MGKVISEISMSFDGFVTGPNMRVGNGMGDGGDRLHDWKFDAKTETDDAIVDEIYASTGAVTGRDADPPHPRTPRRRRPALRGSRP
jgi:hypothetical protein